MAAMRYDPEKTRRLAIARTVLAMAVFMALLGGLLLAAGLISGHIFHFLGLDIPGAALGAVLLLLGAWYIRKALKAIRKLKESGKRGQY